MKDKNLEQAKQHGGYATETGICFRTQTILVCTVLFQRHNFPPSTSETELVMEKQERSWLLATIVPASHQDLLQDAQIPETRVVPCPVYTTVLPIHTCL